MSLLRRPCTRSALLALWALAGLACHDGERAAEPRASPAGAASRETGYSTGDPALANDVTIVAELQLVKAA